MNLGEAALQVEAKRRQNHGMKAELSFPHEHVARLRVENANHQMGPGCTLLTMILTGAALLIGLSDQLILKLLGGALFLLVPFALRSIDRGAMEGDSTLEINRVAMTVRRTYEDGRWKAQKVDFRRLQLFETAGSSDFPAIYSAQLRCRQGVVSLYDLWSKDDAHLVAEALASWLQVPVDRLGLDTRQVARRSLL